MRLRQRNERKRWDVLRRRFWKGRPCRFSQPGGGPGLAVPFFGSTGCHRTNSPIDVAANKGGTRGQPGLAEELPPKGRSNYTSAEDFVQNIDTSEEEKEMGMVDGPFAPGEAARRCNCSEQELCPRPMAAIDAGDKVRTIYDGSRGANQWIQQDNSARTPPPDAGAGAAATGKCVGGSPDPSPWPWPTEDTHWSILKADVTKAHRRIAPTDWKYQISQIDGHWWVNKVGAYGMASAQLYWGRMAALLLRILYYLFFMVDWAFVFVDDFCWLPCSPWALP